MSSPVALQVSVDVLDLPFQRVKAVRCLGRPVGKLRVIRQAVFLDIGQRRRHLLDIERLSPPLIAGAFACLHTGLNVDCQADFAPWRRPVFAAESDAYILRAVARAERFSPQPCKSLLPGARKLIAPRCSLTSYPVASIRRRKSGEVGGPLCQHKINLEL